MAEILDKFEVHTASDLAHSVHRKLKGGIVADAPPEADRVLESVRPLPGWARVAVVVGLSMALWGGIIGGVWWLIAR
ncbi:hypothetical protein LJR225_002668 [Phenylobacterium sp. LjRoot225]|uniref:hypothetical protein n=1 Tax=Phenylobacterium sp. LjRoot225 TaxID=3342285 RepID=UPI003ECD8D50